MSITFEKILNFRDVGKTVNNFLDKKLLQEGVLYRSARLDEASPSDRSRLIDELGLKTVLDLRTKSEHLTADPTRVPGLTYRPVRLTGKAFEKHLVSQLSWWSYIRLIVNYLCGYRMEAIRIISREVMMPRGLIGLGLDTIDCSGTEIASALRALVAPGSLPVLVHCTQGKDRTGIIVVLSLLILGVPLEAISHDYLLTQEGLVQDKESRLAEIENIGLSPEWGDCAPDFVEKVHDYLEIKYGGVEGYLDSIGFDKADRQVFIEALGA